MKDWMIPSIGFAAFIYFMAFVVLYTIKIGGADVTFYGESNNPPPPKTAEEKFLQDISKSIRENF